MSLDLMIPRCLELDLPVPVGSLLSFLRHFFVMFCLWDDLAVWISAFISRVCILERVRLAGSHCFNAVGVGPGHMASSPPCVATNSD